MGGSLVIDGTALLSSTVEARERIGWSGERLAA
jgi:hypothetical protein